MSFVYMFKQNSAHVESCEDVSTWERGNDSCYGLSVLWGERDAAHDGKTSLQICSVFWQSVLCHLSSLQPLR